MKPIDFRQALLIAGFGLRQKFRRAVSKKNKKGTGKAPRALSLSLVLQVLMKIAIGTSISIAFMQYEHDHTRILLMSTAAFIMLFLYGILDYANILNRQGSDDFFRERPVSSRTYRLSQLLETGYSAGIDCILFSIPAFVLTLVYSGELTTAFVSISTIIPSGLFGFLTGISLYYIMVAVLPEKVLPLVSSIVQVVVNMAAMAGIVIMRFLPQDWWYKLPVDSPLEFLPPGLICAMIGPGSGGWYRILIFWAAFALMVYFCVVILGKTYTNSRPQGKGRTNKTSSAPRGISFKTSAEAAVVRRLFFSNLIHDAGFRTALVMVVFQTLILFFLYFFVFDTPVIDPFTAGGRKAFSSTVVLYLSIGMNLVILKNVFSQSRQHRSGWIFFTSPCSTSGLVKEVRFFSLNFILLPYMVLLTIIFTFLTGHLLHSILHFLMLGLVYTVFTGILHYGFPEVPFSAPEGKEAKYSSFFWSLLIAVVLSVIFVIMVNIVYPSPLLYLGTLLFLCAAVVVIEIKGPAIAEKKLAKIEFL